MDLGLDPVHGVRHETYVLLRVEALDGLHQADIAFLDQVGMRQAVAEIVTGDRHHQPQVRQHETAGGLQIGLIAELSGELALFLRRQHRDPVHGLDVGVNIAQLTGQQRSVRERQCTCRTGLSRRRAQSTRKGHCIAHVGNSFGIRQKLSQKSTPAWMLAL